MPDTREALLHRLVIGEQWDRLISEFPDTEELIDVALRLLVKRCLIIGFDKNVSPMHQVGATRLLAQIRYKGLAEDEPSGDKDMSSGMRQKDIEVIKTAISRGKK